MTMNGKDAICYLAEIDFAEKQHRKIIKAKYDGICASTGQKIHRGDLIEYCSYPGIQGWILTEKQKSEVKNDRAKKRCEKD